MGLFWQTGTVLNFYANQKLITEKYCENKDKPQMKCEGKCHLKKQLTVKKIDPINLNQSIQEISFWIYGVEIIEQFYVNDIMQNKDLGLGIISPNSQAHLLAIFVPPNCAG